MEGVDYQCQGVWFGDVVCERKWALQVEAGPGVDQQDQ